MSPASSLATSTHAPTQFFKNWIDRGTDRSSVGSKFSTSRQSKMSLADVVELSPRMARRVHYLADRRVPDIPSGGAKASTKILIFSEKKNCLVEPCHGIER